MNEQEKFVWRLNKNVEEKRSFHIRINDLAPFINEKDYIGVGSAIFSFNADSMNLESVKFDAVGQTFDLNVEDGYKISKSWDLLFRISGFIKNKIETNEKFELIEMQTFFYILNMVN